MENLVQCRKCKNVMMDEEYENHNCLPKIKGWKTIKIAHLYINQDSPNRKIVHILGWDGMDYEFVEENEEKALSKMPYQPKVNTNNTTDKVPEPALRNCYLIG